MSFTYANSAPDKAVIRLPMDISTDEALCEKTIFEYQILYLQNAILSSKLKCLLFYRLTINQGLFALETSKAQLLV